MGSLRAALGLLGALRGAGASSVPGEARRCRPRGESGVGGRWGISAQTLSPTLSESKTVRLSTVAARRIQVSQRSGRPSAPNPASVPWLLAHGLLRPTPRGRRPKRRRCKSEPASPTPKVAAAGAGRCEGGRARDARRRRAARRRGGAAATDGGAHQPGAGWQEPRRGWPERVAAAPRRESRVAASSPAPAFARRLRRRRRRGFLCPGASLTRRGWCCGGGGQGSAADPGSFA